MKPSLSGHRFTLVDVLVVVVILILVIGLILPQMQRSRGTSLRLSCSFQLRQLGEAMQHYESANGRFPPGLFPSPPAPLPPLTFVPDPGDLQYGYQSGFAAVLPYMEVEKGSIHLDRPWFEADNSNAVSLQRHSFFCPSNRSKDVIDLSSLSQFLMNNGSLRAPLPQLALASCDYLLCKGANAALSADLNAIPLEARGIFDVGKGCSTAEITRGASNVFLIGEGAGNTPLYVARMNYTDTTIAPNPVRAGEFSQIDQGYGQGFVQNGQALAATKYCYGSVLGVTAQCGGFPGYGPFDEPLNGTATANPAFPYPGSQKLITAAVDYNQGRDNGPQVAHFDTLSGFRSVHPGGANFCFADGSVRFIQEKIEPAAYRALSTRAGGGDE